MEVLDGLMWATMSEPVRVAATAALIRNRKITSRARMAQLVRETLPPRGTVGRLIDLVLAEVDRQERVRLKRMTAHGSRVEFGREELILRHSCRSQTEVGEAWERCDYRKPSGKWAGGDCSLNVVFGRPSITTQTFKSWSGNGKWSGNNLQVRIQVPMNWRRNVGPNPVTDDGLLILDRKGDRITVVTKGRGFKLSTMERNYVPPRT